MVYKKLKDIMQENERKQSILKDFIANVIIKAYCKSTSVEKCRKYDSIETWTSLKSKQE